MLVYPGVGPFLAYPTMKGGRGPFVGTPGAWRWALSVTPYLAGPVCPVAADAYRITVQLVYDVPPTADLTRWAGIYFGVATDDCPDDVDTSTGYLVALRWNGTLEVFGQPSDRQPAWSAWAPGPRRRSSRRCCPARWPPGSQ